MSALIMTLRKVYSRFLATGAGLCMFLVFSVVLVNAVRRYTVGQSLIWGEEFPVFLAVYGVMFGMAWAYLDDHHVNFSLLSGLFNEKINEWLGMLTDVIALVVGVMLAWSGVLFVAKRGKIEASGMRYFAEDLSNWTGLQNLSLLAKLYPYQSAIVLGGVLLALAALLRLMMRLAHQKVDHSPAHVIEGGVD